MKSEKSVEEVVGAINQNIESAVKHGKRGIIFNVVGYDKEVVKKAISEIEKKYDVYTGQVPGHIVIDFLSHKRGK